MIHIHLNPPQTLLQLPHGLKCAIQNTKFGLLQPLATFINQLIKGIIQNNRKLLEASFNQLRIF